MNNKKKNIYTKPIVAIITLDEVDIIVTSLWPAETTTTSSDGSEMSI